VTSRTPRPRNTNSTATSRCASTMRAASSCTSRSTTAASACRTRTPPNDAGSRWISTTRSISSNGWTRRSRNTANATASAMWWMWPATARPNTRPSGRDCVRWAPWWTDRYWMPGKPGSPSLRPPRWAANCAATRSCRSNRCTCAGRTPKCRTRWSTCSAMPVPIKR
jgi:hypothetical protein